MSLFDGILPEVARVLRADEASLGHIGPLVINRDLNGRVRLLANERLLGDDGARRSLEAIAGFLSERLGPHGFPADQMVLYEPDVEELIRGGAHYPLEGEDRGPVEGVSVVDRLAMETDWTSIVPEAPGAPRVVFFSIKGGVGRSTALALTAWSLAQQGKRVLVLDLDLESPGLSSSLLPDERRPAHGVTDWLVEDLVDNGAAVFGDLVATSDLSREGEILVVPAHGRDPGEYVSKLGRVWMPKVDAKGTREAWPRRLNRLLGELEQERQPDVILIDSRAGMDEVASACVADLGASLVLMFAMEGEQTWSGYRILFRHWNRAGVAREVRERLQVVGALVPELGGAEYARGLREEAWSAFSEELYDEVPAGEPTEGRWSFDIADETAPHFPWLVRWHRGYAALGSLHPRIRDLDPDEVKSIFGPLLEGISRTVGEEGEDHG